MRKTCFLITFLITSLLTYSQTIKKPKPETKVVWTWNGKVLSKKDFQDSIFFKTKRFNDSCIMQIKNRKIIVSK